MDEKKVVTPVQPYLRLDAEDYKEILNKRMGISSFYEFQVKQRGMRRVCRHIPLCRGGNIQV